MRFILSLFVLLFTTHLWANSRVFSCSMIGDLECLKKLSQQGVDLTQKNDNLRTPLHIASFHGHFETVQFLIKKNHNIEYIMARDLLENTALHRAVDSHGHHPETVQLLAEAYSDPKHFLTQNIYGQAPIHLAAMFGHYKIVKALLAAYPNRKHLLAQSRNGETPLHTAARAGIAETVQVLINHSSSPKDYIMVKNLGQSTPLHTAATHGKTNIIKLLIDYSSASEEYIMAKDLYGDTPLHKAVSFEHSEAVRFLVKALPSNKHIFIKDKYQRTAFELSLLQDRPSSAHIIFGNSSQYAKKRLIKLCQENQLINQHFCEQFIFAIEKQNLNTNGSYL